MCSADGTETSGEPRLRLVKEPAIYCDLKGPGAETDQILDVELQGVCVCSFTLIPPLIHIIT